MGFGDFIQQGTDWLEQSRDTLVPYIPTAVGAASGVPVPPAAPPGQNSPAQTGGASWLDAIPAIFTGAAQAGGAAYAGNQQAQGQIRAAEIQAEANRTVPNPYYDEYMRRYLAIMDNILQRRGITPTIPAGGLRAPGGQNANPVGQAPAASPAPQQPTMSGPDQKRKFESENKDETSLTTAPSGEDNSYRNAALAAKLGERRLGLDSAPKLPTTRDFQEQDTARKKEELDNIYKYIYGQRSLGGL